MPPKIERPADSGKGHYGDESAPDFLLFAREARGIPTPQKLLLYVLADLADARGVCWPTVATLRAITGMNRALVAASLQILETRGLIAVERAEGRVNGYRLLPGGRP
jgi:DNA-binding MarR family transcriptional regulator